MTCIVQLNQMCYNNDVRCSMQIALANCENSRRAHIGPSADIWTTRNGPIANASWCWIALSRVRHRRAMIPTTTPIPMIHKYSSRSNGAQPYSPMDGNARTNSA